MRNARRYVAPAVGFLATALLSSCEGDRPPVPPKAEPVVLVATDDYWPEQSPEFFSVNYGTGTEVFHLREDKMLVPAVVNGWAHRLKLEYEGQVLDEENYAVTDKGISLIAAGPDRFEPPIPLLEYGRTVGEHWTWSGLNAPTGDTPMPALAEIRTAQEMLQLKAGTYSVVRVTVQVRFPDRPDLADEMRFYFSPGQGLVKAVIAGYAREMLPQNAAEQGER